MIRNIPKSQFLSLRKICPDTSDYIKKNNEYLNFFLKQGFDSSKLKMLAKTGDELLPQNKKGQNKKTIVVTTWHPTLKHLSKILQEKYQYIEKDIYRKKSIIKFRKSETISLEQISRKQMIKRNLN